MALRQHMDPAQNIHHFADDILNAYPERLREELLVYYI